MKNMTKSDLVEKLTGKTNLTKKKVEAVVNCVFDTMFEALVNSDRIEIRGFGSWYVKNYKSYVGRNPKTGSSVDVPEKKLPFFKVGKELKKRIDQAKTGNSIRG
jgi:integration host factor subunit beta